MPTLYIVPTPIGNLEDVTLRALRVLGEVELIAAEDTRVTRRLLDRYGVKTRLTSLNEHNHARKMPELLSSLAESDIALVSDAGTPAINDPGRELIAAASLEGISVVALPGASAVTTAVAVSGIVMEGFVFVGFLPRRSGRRRNLLMRLADEARALVAFETPHRLADSLADMLETLGDRRIAVCRELTKLHEEVFRGSIAEASAYFSAPRGEFTLVVEGAPRRTGQQISKVEFDTVQMLAGLRAEGYSARDAIAAVGAETGISRRRLYAEWLSGKPPG